MAKRKPIPKTVRFEVFKRDKFTCQYCGAKAPEVVLHLDHIHPHSKGGSDDILNLLSACQDCNGGKGARRLDDASAINKQHNQLAELQERREQLQMMLEWRQGLAAETKDKVDIVVDALRECSGYGPNQSGRQSIRKWLKQWPLDMVLKGVAESFDTYLKYNVDRVDDRSWELAFSKIPAVIRILVQTEEKPYLPKLLYIQGICRNRFNNKWLKIVPLMERCVQANANIESIEACAKSAYCFDDFERKLVGYLEKQGRAA